MMLVYASLTNTAILSIFKIILLEFDYRTVNVFFASNLTTETSSKDVVLEMMEILRKHLKPANILSISDNAMNRHRCEEPVLNVLFLMDTTVDLLDDVKENIYPNDITVILDSRVHNNTQMEMRIYYDRMLRVSNKVIVINNSSILALYPFRHHKMDILPLYPFDHEMAKIFIETYVHSRKFLKQEKNLTIFLQYLSPRSMVAFLEKGCYHIGSDGSLAEILLKLLSAKGTFVSDVGLMYPQMVRNWADPSRVQEQKKFYEIYNNAMTGNILTTYNRR